MDKNRLKKYVKSGRGFLYAFIICAIIIAVLLGSIIKKNQEVQGTEKELLEIETNAESEASLVDKYAFIQVQTITDYFATRGEEKYYFVSDGTYIYIAELNEKNFEKVKPIYDYTYSEDENVEVPERVKIIGMTREIPNEFAKIIIEEYNKMMGEELLTDENWETYVGAVYLETSASPVDVEMEIVFIGLVGIFALIFLIVFIPTRLSVKKTLKKFEENNELEKVLDQIEQAKEESKYLKGKVLLTDSYYVDLTSGFKVYRYEDIKWIYMHQLRQNGILYTKSIMIQEKGSKKVEKTASSSSMFGKDNEFQRLFEDILGKVPEAIKGYTKENKKAAKEL